MITMVTDPDRGLYRLMSWLSPSFPVGAYSYSHGIEFAFEAGDVTDADSLLAWIEGILEFGAGRLDGVLFRCAWQAMASNDEALLAWAIDTADIMRGSREMALENSAQGAAFMETLQKSWHVDGLERLNQLHAQRARPVSYPVVVGAAAGLSGIDQDKALTAYLHGFISNLVSAGVRMIPLGQTAGQQILFALEAAVATAVKNLLAASITDLQANIGSAAVMVDWSSMQHETQYTRIFRS
ncbi:MAG: urease accessory protein UreF [Rhodospirillales bacterium]|nr:urease accessory protein UreF [Rhodospirillales bacterium]